MARIERRAALPRRGIFGVKLSFEGADRGVTGSCHLLECRGKRILVDCGLFQGGREVREENVEPFGFEPRSIDYVLLTHAHLDHCGRLPLLTKQGFNGEIVATEATFELARLVLFDAARLQEEESRHHQSTTPLYVMMDAVNATRRFGRTAAYGRQIEIADGIRVDFLDAGHILGSASVLVEVEEEGRRRTILFSGDIGNSDRPLLGKPQTPEIADYVVMETTYGDRQHRSFAASADEMLHAVASTLDRGGNVLIPTFALERAQEVLYVLQQGVAQQRLPPSMPVFLDSPLAISATDIFRRHPESYGPHAARLFANHIDPFGLPGLRFSREVSDSKAINRITGGAVIIAGNGMCTGGRIRQHLLRNLGHEACGVIFVGYAANGTPARQIIDGAHHVRLLGEEVAVRARIHTINGFSAHADQAELLAWHRRIAGQKITFLVHGEEAAMRGFAAKLDVQRVEMPTLHQVYDL
jgi:metallo-beta-lactamase family protein